MSERLDSLIGDIRRRVRAKDPTAVERAVQLAGQYPDEPEVWFVLAFAHSINRDMDGAVAAMTRMKEVSPPDPSIFYFRGDYEYDRGNLEAALADFTEGIALSKQLEAEFYLESLYFLRADVLVALDRKAEALADLAHVRDGHGEWTTKLRTKADILADCGVPRRPWRAMSEPLDSLIDEIKIRVHDDLATAFERTAQLAERYPDEPDVWHTLAYVHAVNSDIDSAVLAINRMMDIAPPPPAIVYLRAHFVRGYYEHRRGNPQAALADFDQAMALSEQLHDESGLEELYFRRADVLVALGRKAEARADLAHVQDGFAKYTTRLRTKADILADCEG